MPGESRLSDTSAEAQAVQDEVYRRLGPEGRMNLGLRMCEDARAMTLAGIRRRNPEFTEREVRGELIRILYGLDLDIP